MGISCLYVTLFISPARLHSQTVETTINLQEIEGFFGLAVAVNSKTNLIYISSIPPRVIAIDGSTNEIIKNVSIDIHSPRQIVVNDLTNRLYINDGMNLLYIVIDLTTYEKIGAGPIGVELCSTGPKGSLGFDIDVNPITDLIYVAGSTSDAVSTEKPCYHIIVADGSNNDMVASTSIDAEPLEIIVNSQTNQIYAALGQDFENVETDDFIIRIDGKTNEIANSVKIGPSIIALDIDPITNNVYIGAEKEDNYDVIVMDSNLENIIATIEVIDPFNDLKLNPATNHLFLSHRDSNTVSVIDTLTNDFVKKLEVGLNPGAIAINPASNMVYVVNNLSNTITVIKDGVNETPLPAITPTPSSRPEVSPTTSQPSSTISVSPVTAKKSVRFNKAIVTVADKSGVGISGVRIKAVSKGLMTNVVPKIAVTDINGNVKFKFRFGLVSKNGQIVFTTGDGLTTVLAQERE